MTNLPLNRRYWAFTIAQDVELLRIEWEIIVTVNGEQIIVPFDFTSRTTVRTSTESLIKTLTTIYQKQLEAELLNPNSPGSPTLESHEP